MSKYGNKKVSVDGILFDSIKERDRYMELKLLQRAGEISKLALQPEFILQIGFTDGMGNKHRPIKYIADFQYYDEKKNRFVVEDVKGYSTPYYKMKKKLLLYSYQDLYFVEI